MYNKLTLSSTVKVANANGSVRKISQRIGSEWHVWHGKHMCAYRLDERDAVETLVDRKVVAEV